MPAHLTLFHKLDAAQLDCLRAHWLSSRAASPALQFTGPRFLGRGVAIEIVSKSLADVRSRYVSVVSHAGALTRQDQQPFRAHVTVQNKVTPTTARELHTALAENFEPWQGHGESILVWRYLGGPWELESEHSLLSYPAA